jgi:hypothetical protein
MIDTNRRLEPLEDQKVYLLVELTIPFMLGLASLCSRHLGHPACEHLRLAEDTARLDQVLPCTHVISGAMAVEACLRQRVQLMTPGAP